VKTKQTAGTGRDVRFRTTQWELVLKAQGADSSQQARCLSELCSRYWFPLYKFALFTGLSHEDAQDLTQSFFLHLLEKAGLQQVDPAKGRFRSFLLASFRNHFSTHRQYASAAKRGGGKPSIDLDAQRFAVLMRQEVAQTLLNPRDTDSEIHALYSALRSTEGRLRDELGIR
jgi:DNA-directed RNA polymerase specialized sigma24 family protein